MDENAENREDEITRISAIGGEYVDREDDDAKGHNTMHYLVAPDEILLPQVSAATVEGRRKSAEALQVIRKASIGMLPSGLAHIVRRHASAHREYFPSGNSLPSKLYEDEDLALRDYDVLETDNDYGRTSSKTFDRDWLVEQRYRFGGPMTMPDVASEFRGCCTLETVKRRLPITQWLPKYSREDLTGDVIAGLTVGLTVVPQCLAYAVIADVDLEYGLNSSYLGCFIYTLLGTSKDVTVGPTAILSLLTGTFVNRTIGKPGEWAVLLSFFVGCFQLAIAFLRLGFIINFVSVPVLSGFTQAAVVVIVLSQVKNMMGIKFGAAADTVIETIGGYIKHASKTNGWDVLLGCVCITLLMLMGYMKLPHREGSVPRWYNILTELVRLCNVSRYAIIVMGATVLNYCLISTGTRNLSSTGNVTAKLSPPKAPNFAVGGLAFGEVLRTLGSGLVMVPLLGMMESVAIAKTFAHKFRYNISVTQEFIALGTANLVSSFFGSYAVGGAFTRSALNAESGVRTPMGGIVTGVFVIIAIVTLSSILQFIPKAALAAVIICACINMLDFTIFRELYYIRRTELFLLILTMVACLVLRVDYGLLVGFGASLLTLLYPAARPVVIVTKHGRSYADPNVTEISQLEKRCIKVTPQGPVYFPAADFLRDIFNDTLFADTMNHPVLPSTDQLSSAQISDSKLLTRKELIPIVFDGIHLNSSDYSTLRALRSVYVTCRSARRRITFVNIPDDILDIIIPQRKIVQTIVEYRGIGKVMTPYKRA